MSAARGPSLESRRAFFRAALAAQCAGETHVMQRRVIAALLRTDSVRDFCARAQIDSARVMGAADGAGALPFHECERRVNEELAEQHIALGSSEHRAAVRLRPLDPRVRAVVDALIERDGCIDVSPLQLLLDLLRADPAIAAELALAGLRLEDLAAELRNR